MVDAPLKPDEVSDEALIAHCLDGSQRHWALFVERYAKLIHWSIRRIFFGTSYQSRQDVFEEVFQEVFEKILRGGHLARMRKVKSVPKFVCIVAQRTASDKRKYLARASRRDVPIDPENSSAEGAVLDEKGDQYAGNMADPSEQALLREKESVLRKIIDELDEHERACIEFHYVYGRSHLEISQLLGNSRDTISSILRRAREKIRMKLIARGYKDL